MRHYRDYTDDQIIEAVKTSKSKAGVLKKLGLTTSGGNHARIKRIIKKMGLDTSHWTGQLWSKGRSLKEYSEYKKKTPVKNKLLNDRGHKCECCGLTRWMDRDITLEVHHIDGKRKNNVDENLKLLCPNCHSYTPNWRGRNRGKS